MRWIELYPCVYTYDLSFSYDNWHDAKHDRPNYTNSSGDMIHHKYLNTDGPIYLYMHIYQSLYHTIIRHIRCHIIRHIKWLIFVAINLSNRWTQYHSHAGLAYHFKVYINCDCFRKVVKWILISYVKIQKLNKDLLIYMNVTLLLVTFSEQCHGRPQKAQKGIRTKKVPAWEKGSPITIQM